MRLTKTDFLLAGLNAKRGKKYPDIGYLYFANVAGDGRTFRTIYEIINESGGVSRSELNHASNRKQCQLIVAAIAAS